MNAGSPPPLLVLCVDDNELVADALRRRIEREPAMAWAGVVRNGAEAYAAVLELKPHVVLMDIDMPGVDSFSVVERLAAEAPDSRVIMFSGHVDPGYINRAMDCGAWGYLSKNDDVDRLLDGIRRAGAGDLAMSREVEAVQRAARGTRASGR